MVNIPGSAVYRCEVKQNIMAGVHGRSSWKTTNFPIHGEEAKESDDGIRVHNPLQSHVSYVLLLGSTSQ
jgi:hypothetical protein